MYEDFKPILWPEQMFALFISLLDILDIVYVQMCLGINRSWVQGICYRALVILFYKWISFPSSYLCILGNEVVNKFFNSYRWQIIRSPFNWATFGPTGKLDNVAHICIT